MQRLQKGMERAVVAVEGRAADVAMEAMVGARI